MQFSTTGRVEGRIDLSALFEAMQLIQPYALSCKQIYVKHSVNDGVPTIYFLGSWVFDRPSLKALMPQDDYLGLRDSSSLIDYNITWQEEICFLDVMLSPYNGQLGVEVSRSVLGQIGSHHENLCSIPSWICEKDSCPDQIIPRDPLASQLPVSADLTI